MTTIKFSNCKCQVERGKFNINEIPLDCPATWSLISSGHTIGVFQLEKKLGQDWARKVKPTNMEELSALVSLLRPGPLEAGISQDYADVKFRKKKMEFLHPCLKPILEVTYGCMVYQEQALQIAVKVAGFGPETADDLRKAIGKKKPELMAKLKKDFISGANKTGLVAPDVAEEVFGWIEKCQRYSFNKSHAMSYAMIGYQTAWLKCHFPNEFFTSYLTHSHYKSDPKDEIYRLVQDARLFNVTILPPDIRKNNIHFKMVDEPQKAIAFGLAHMRGVGQSAIQKIVAAGLDSSGAGVVETSSMEMWSNFLAAVPALHRNIGIALVKSGACDCYGMSRSDMVRELEVILGTTIIDDNGNRKDDKGLTAKERGYFFERLATGTSTKDVLLEMSQEPNELPKRLNQMKKEELVSIVGELIGSIAHDSIAKLKKAELTQMAKDSGYIDPIVQRACANPKRRQIMAEKADQLKVGIIDTSTGKATAEKHFLGIALSCSPADDADDALATHTCLDFAKAANGEQITICAIIDDVKTTKTKRGKNPGQAMCFLTISDSTYSIDHAVVFPHSYRAVKACCKIDMIVLIYGEKKNGSFIVSDIQKLM